MRKKVNDIIPDPDLCIVDKQKNKKKKKTTIIIISILHL